MVKRKALAINKELNLVLQELKENPFRKFRIAFCLMSIIPFLVFFYLLVVKLFSLDILVGDIGTILFISIVVSLCGSLFGYGIIKSILVRIIFYAAKAKQSDQLKSIFVANVSHELKSPLSIIKVNLLNVLDGLLGKISEEQKRIIRVCDSIIERMRRLINDLLDLHRLEAGMVGVKRKLCKLDQILEKEIEEFKALINKKQIKLTREIAARDLWVWADEDKIMQVINNLLSNAIKYTPVQGTILLKAYGTDGFVRIEVLDTAEAIPDEKLNKIFDKFERLDFTQEGTGLGLTISKDIVEMHKGSIWAERRPEKGNKFVVVLPHDLRSKPR